MVRKLQPKIVLNDRLDLDEGWDIKTPEQFQPREWIKVNGQPVVWEACQTFSGSWVIIAMKQAGKAGDTIADADRHRQ